MLTAVASRRDNPHVCDKKPLCAGPLGCCGTSQAAWGGRAGPPRHLLASCTTRPDATLPLAWWPVHKQLVRSCCARTLMQQQDAAELREQQLSKRRPNATATEPGAVTQQPLGHRQGLGCEQRNMDNVQRMEEHAEHRGSWRKMEEHVVLLPFQLVSNWPARRCPGSAASHSPLIGWLCQPMATGIKQETESVLPV